MNVVIKLLFLSCNFQVLDSRDLKVSKMVCEGKQLEYTVGEKHEAFGSKLIIQLPKTYSKLVVDILVFNISKLADVCFRLNLF